MEQDTIERQQREIEDLQKKYENLQDYCCVLAAFADKYYKIYLETYVLRNNANLLPAKKQMSAFKSGVMSRRDVVQLLQNNKL